MSAAPAPPGGPREFAVVVGVTVVAAVGLAAEDIRRTAGARWCRASGDRPPGSRRRSAGVSRRRGRMR